MDTAFWLARNRGRAQWYCAVTMHGEIQLTVAQRDGISMLADVFVTPPFKVLTLPSPTGTATMTRWQGALKLMQMSASPGLLAGDRVEIRVSLAQGAALDWQTQSFARVLSMDAGHAEQNLVIDMATGSRLCYVPHPLVLHAGAQLRQCTCVDLSDACALILGEVIASGRRLNDEHFAFAALSSRVQVYHRQQPILLDNIQWKPEQYALNVLGQMEGFSHQAGLCYVNTNQDFDATPLYMALAEYLDATQKRLGANILIGVSQPSSPLLMVRGLAYHAEVLQELLQTCAQIMKTNNV